MTPVKSAFIAAIDHDEETSTLIVQFVNGKLYTYDDVPSDEFHKLLFAKSVGKHFTAHIKPIYPATLVPTLEPSRPAQPAADAR